MQITELRYKTTRYVSLYRSSLHLKFSLANAIIGLLPDYVSGVVRGRIYRWVGLDIGKGAFIMGNLILTSGIPGFYDKLSIGSGTVISDRVTINLDAEVRIGANVTISPHVLIYTGSHRTGPSSRRMGEVTSIPVTIEDGAWVRLGAIIVPGVRVGRGSIVAAGAVVLNDVPPDTYVQGNPAVVTRQLSSDDG
jgi:acetyltransferase-like isoleucine patch superfamily enzyme